MEFYHKDVNWVIKYFSSNSELGLNNSTVKINSEKFGSNVLTQKKEKGFFRSLFDVLKDPMLIILCFSFILSFGTDLGQFLKIGVFDFTECFGIFVAISLSVLITLVMEKTSKKAFLALNRIYDNLTVKVIREGETIIINQKFICAGDIVLLEAGDKIVADGILLSANELEVDEAALTGESNNQQKVSNVTFPLGTPLAERKNYVYSGTFVKKGSGKMLVTAVGDNTEIGVIAKELNKNKEDNSPLQQKLARLGKTITLIGLIATVIVFTLSLIKLISINNVSFSSIQDLFISSVVLMVAAVPEGLPTIVALSLALNMIKLARENALIKKMISTETAGAVSVICTDKTGTLTKNKMQVFCVCDSNFCYSNKDRINDNLKQNFLLNNSAILIEKNGKKTISGSGTESCLIEYFLYNEKKIDINEYRKKYYCSVETAFTSENKKMITKISDGKSEKLLLKGAPEVILEDCDLTFSQKQNISKEIAKHQQKSRRVLCFAHKDDESNAYYQFDGYVAISDPIRDDVKKAILDCKKAGIKVKILTGDNIVTASAIAEEIGILENKMSVVNAKDLEKLDDMSFKKALDKVCVIARSTPALKLRVVKVLKEKGEVVAVTGDGINDAPAIKHADIGIAMGISGSEITKEAADVVLLDDSFLTVVKAISFGRSIYRNIQRFIIFQLSVNLSALLFIMVSAILGLPAPFNTLQLLWINVIMDGPPALTLGLEPVSNKLMTMKPIKKEQSIVSIKMLITIIINGIIIGGVMIMQMLTNFLGASVNEKDSAIFTLFILFNLFNAFNCRELGSKSIFSSLKKNKIMCVTFLIVFIVHVIIVEVASGLFKISPMSFSLWIKCLVVSFSIVAVWEILKWVFRFIKGENGVFKKKRQLEEIIYQSNK